MAKAAAKFKTEATITLEIPERQFLALEAISGYDNKTTVAMLLNKLGVTYLGPYQTDMVQFLNDIREEGSSIKRRLARVKEAAHGN